MSLVIYSSIKKKLLEKHGVTEEEVAEAFLNRTGKLATEIRPHNQGDFPRRWFVAETDEGRRLKVVFAQDPTEPGPVIITAYEPSKKEEAQYAEVQKQEP